MREWPCNPQQLTSSTDPANGLISTLSGCVWRLSIQEIKLPPEASRYYGPLGLSLSSAEVLIYRFQFMDGRVCHVDDILSRQPDLRVLRDPPTLAGQRVRYVILFHLEPGNASVRRCKVRAYAWTVPSLGARLEMMDKQMSAMLAQSVFAVAKRDFENSDPNEIRARWASAALELVPRLPLVSLSFCHFCPLCADLP